MIAENVFALAVEGLEFCDNGGSLDDYLDEKLAGSLLRKTVSSVLFEYFRNKARIDYYITLLSKGRVIPLARRALRVAMTQILYQTGIEKHTASNVAVEFVKKKKGKFASGFVNAVMRKVCMNGFSDEADKKMPEQVKAGIPEQLFRKWKADLTNEQFEQVTASLRKQADFTFRICGGSSIEKAMAAEDFSPVSTSYLSKFRFYRTIRPEQIINSELFRNGLIYIQDPASVLVGELIPEGLYENILDLCSAPGGKTVMLSELFPMAKITAADRSAQRLEKVMENVERFSLENVTLLLADALEYEFKKNYYDLILADVPCSNSGVFRRRPDAIWKFSDSKLSELVHLQSEILKKGSCFLKSGGILVYSTCSIDKEENRDQIESFLAGHSDFRLLKSVQLLPGMENDGGFAAVLRRCGDA